MIDLFAWLFASCNPFVIQSCIPAMCWVTRYPKAIPMLLQAAFALYLMASALQKFRAKQFEIARERTIEGAFHTSEVVLHMFSTLLDPQ